MLSLRVGSHRGIRPKVFRSSLLSLSAVHSATTQRSARAATFGLGTLPRRSASILPHNLTVNLRNFIPMWRDRLLKRAERRAGLVRSHSEPAQSDAFRHNARAVEINHTSFKLCSAALCSSSAHASPNRPTRIGSWTRDQWATTQELRRGQPRGHNPILELSVRRTLARLTDRTARPTVRRA